MKHFDVDRYIAALEKFRDTLLAHAETEVCASIRYEAAMEARGG